MKPSVIVCTRNRGHKIRECLESIDASLRHAKPSEAEIVVVNNGSTDDTEEVVKEVAKHTHFPLRLITEPKPGLNVARNCGLRNASGDLLIYTDDDCRMSESYISDALRHHGSDAVPVLRFGGVHLGDNDDWPISINTSPVARRWQKDDGTACPRSSDIIGCNMTFPKAIPAKIGRFDERFGNRHIPGGDDTDFGFRAYQAGFPVECVPDMIVYHFHGRRGLDAVTKLVRNYSIGGGALYAKLGLSHPHVINKLRKKPGGSAMPQDAVREAEPDERKAVIGRLFRGTHFYYTLGILRFYRASLLEIISSKKTRASH